MDVPVDGGRPDAEAGGQPGVGVSAAQVRQHQQRLATGGQLPPTGPDRGTMGGQALGQEGEGRSGQVDRGWVHQQLQAPGQTTLVLVDRLIYQELRHVWSTDTPAPDPRQQVGKGSLISFSARTYVGRQTASATTGGPRAATRGRPGRRGRSAANGRACG